MAYLWIALGGALGSMGRYWAANFIAECAGKTFPWGTLLVNVSGSLAIGLLAAWLVGEDRWQAHSRWREFLMIGICGGYTTFSSFSLDTLNLLRASHWFQAGAYAVLSLVLCLVAVWLGHLLGQLVNR
jgi:CrcB protein